MPRLNFISQVDGASSIELTEAIITIGRSLNNVVCIEDPNISKHHALLIAEDNTYKIYDLHSFNGTWVNGQRITVAALQNGDDIRIGYLDLKFDIGAVRVAAAPSVKPAPTPAPVIRPATGPVNKPLPVPAPAAATPIPPATARPQLGLAGKPAVPPAPPVAKSPPMPVAPPPPVAPPVAAAPASQTPSPAETVSPAKEEKRLLIRIPEKKPAAPAPPTPVPEPVKEVPPEPAEPVVEVPTKSESAPSPKKWGMPSGTPPAKFKLKRE